MLDLADFLDPGQIGALVPDEYARYRPAVADGLIFFLGELPAARTLAILAEQAELPEDAGVEERLVAIARHSPALHKLGQVLARDRRLPARLRRLLQDLESMHPTQSLEEVRAAVEGEIGPLARQGVELDGPPLAEASVAIVTPFLWQDGGDGEPRRGVFKVLKPGIEEILEEDLALLQKAGGWLDERCRRYGLPAIAYEDTFAQVRELLQREVHLRVEQEHLVLARAAYAGMGAVVVPQVFPFSSARMTAMERIDGRKVTDAHDLPAPARRSLAALVAEALIARPVWSREGDALFHGDPHAGNLLVTPDRRLALLDWSLAGTLGKPERIQLAQILLGAVTLNPGRIAGAIGDLAESRVDPCALARIVQEGLQGVALGRWPGFSWLTRLLDRAVMQANVRFGADLILFRKALHTVEGVISDISEEVRLDMVLAAQFLATFGLEAGLRTVAPPGSRAFASHISNLDLAGLALAAPMTSLRYWSLLWGAGFPRPGLAQQEQ